MLPRLALTLLVGLCVVSLPCAAQDKDAPGGFPRKSASKKPAATAAKPAAGAKMDVRPAPATGTMPGRQTPAPKGRLGTEPVHQEKLGSPPPTDSKDRPPRPQ